MYINLICRKKVHSWAIILKQRVHSFTELCLDAEDLLVDKIVVEVEIEVEELILAKKSHGSLK